MGILCDHIITTNLLVLLLKTKSIITAFLLVIGIVREALAVVVKRWTPVLFSCQILLLNNVVAAAQQRLMKLPNMDMANRSRSAFDPYYCSLGSEGREDVRCFYTMMLNDQNNNSNPAVFIRSSSVNTLSQETKINNRYRANGTVAANEKAFRVEAARASDATPQ